MLRAMEAAFFDLDKTVIAKSSVLAFGRTFYKEGLLSRATLVKGLYAQVVYMLVGADENKMERVREAMLALTRGWERDHVAGIVRETLDDIVSPIIFNEAIELFEEHHGAGRKVFIVSSSPIEIVEPLARYMGVDETIASRARLDAEGRYTGELDFYCYGPNKAEAMLAIAKEEDIDLDASYAYSDSVTDVPMLEVVGHPVAVNPDRDLQRIARDRGWEVREFRQPVRLRDRVPVPPAGPTAAVGGAALAVAGATALYLWLRRRAHAARRASIGGARDASRQSVAHARDAVSEAGRAVTTVAEVIAREAATRVRPR
jgi:HAD superfamily hydrolase (TIGR01490 family)